MSIIKQAGNCVIRGSSELNESYIALRNAVSNSSKKSLDTTWIRNLLDHVVICIIRSLAAPAQSPHYKAIARAKQFIGEHLTRRIKIHQIARAASLGVARFHELFHSETGETPAEYHQRLRLEQAQIKLRGTAESVTDIASQYGFYSAQHFSGRFRKIFGMTPSAYRERFAKQ